MPDVGGVTGDRLRSFIERVERLEEEIKGLNGDKSEVYQEAKATGFNVKVMKEIVRIRRMDKDDLDEHETLVDLYKQALGMLPLFEAAEEREETGTRVANARAPAREPAPAVATAAKKFVDSVAKNPGDSVSIILPDGSGTRVKNEGGKKVVEAIEPDAAVTEAQAHNAGYIDAVAGRPLDEARYADEKLARAYRSGHEFGQSKRAAA